MSDAAKQTRQVHPRTARSAKQGRLKLFLRSTVFDFLLTVVISGLLIYVVSYGFESAADLRRNLALEMGISAILLVILYLGSWSRRAVIFAVVGYLVASIAVVAAFAIAMPSGTPFYVDGQINDVSENWVIFGLVCVVVPLVVYLLSRKTFSVVFLLLAGVIACSTIQYLYRDFIEMELGTPVILCVYVAIGALFILQGYRQSVMGAKRLKKISFGGAFLHSLIMALVCVLVGAGVFAGIIANLGLTTIEIKPFQEYYQRPEVLYSGIYDEQSVTDPNLTSNITNDDQTDTNQQAEGQGDVDSETQTVLGTASAFVEQVIDSLDLNSWIDAFMAIFYRIPKAFWYLLLFLLVGVVAFAVWWRIRLREKRLERIEDLPLGEQVVYLYDFLMGRLARLGFAKPATFTLLEFALASRSMLAPYDKNEEQLDFLNLTLIYQRAAYGGGEVCAEDHAKVLAYYRAFFANAHSQLGHVKWALNYFWRI